MKIQIIDSILCKADKELIPHIAPCLAYEKSYWKQMQFRKVQKVYQASFIDRRNGIFLSGFLPKVKEFLNAKNISFKIDGEFERIIFKKTPNLPRINLREDQKTLIQQAYEKQRGVILSPTGSGKTVIAAGFLSMFPKANVLFLCNALDIIKQTADEFEKFGFANIAVLGGENKNWLGSRIVVSTIQTFVKINPKTYLDYFDIVIIDETQDVTKKGQFGEVLQHLLSPIRIGLTATFPKDKERALSIEGLLGPIIGEITIQEGVDLKIIAKPKIVLVSVPQKPISSYKYKDIYQIRIVENRVRNKLIGQIVKEIIEKKETVLIMVKKIVHGENIQRLAKDLFNIDIAFVQGATESESRTKLKDLLEKGKTKAVVCTAVWKKGINIKSLNNIINAGSGKSEIQVLQFLGRGLRRTKDKTFVKIYDFLDSNRYLAEHSILRLKIYVENGWDISSYGKKGLR